MKIEDMYRLMDGTQADPSDCSRGDDGILRHKSGVKVAIDGDGKPETIGATAEKKPEAAEAPMPAEANPADPPPVESPAAPASDPLLTTATELVPPATEAEKTPGAPT